MCGIWYIRKYSHEYLHKAIQMQVDRWTDAYGYVSDWIIDKHDTKNLTTSGFADFCTARTVVKDWKWIAWHTRKTSVWIKDVANAHPHKIWDYLIFQNWTEKKIIERAKFWYLDKFEEDKSDTHYLLSFILDKLNWDHSVEKMTWILESLKNSTFVIWSVFVYDIKKDIMYFISDATRPSYVEIADHKVVTISSKWIWLEDQYDENKEHEYTNACVLAFKASTWKILFWEDEIKNTDKWLVKKTSTYSYDYTGSYWYERDYYWKRRSKNQTTKTTYSSWVLTRHDAKNICKRIQEKIYKKVPLDIADELVWEKINLTDVYAMIFYVRSIADKTPDAMICFTHRKLFLDMYEMFEKSTTWWEFEQAILDYFVI